MKLLFEFLPLILFFIAFKWQGIYVATGVAIAAAVLQFAWMKLRGRTISTMQWISLGVIVVFGGATLAVSPDFLLSGEMYNTPLDQVTARVRMTVVTGGNRR